MNKYAIPIIDEIMSDGKERTTRNIVDALYEYIESNKRRIPVPTAREIAYYLSRNDNYIKEKTYIQGHAKSTKLNNVYRKL